MLDVAIDAAKQAGQLALRYFKTQPKVSYKADKSPVTRADIEAEKLIRKIISKNYPDHGIIGEELPQVSPKAKYQWVIDPIDGTRDFIRQIPHWAVYIAVLEKEKPIISVIYFPNLGDLITAESGKGAYINKQKVKISVTKNIKDAYISFGSLKRFDQFNNLKKLINVVNNTFAPRSYGNLGFQFFLQGKVDILLEPYGMLHDFAAPSLIVKEAGGKWSNFTGERSLTSGKLLMTNRFLHSQVLKLLNS